MEGLNFLKKNFNKPTPLHSSPEVESVARRTKVRTGEKVPQNPADRTQNYLDRFTEIIERKEPAKRERGIEALKRVLHDKFVIKEEDFSQSYYDKQGEIVESRGQRQELIDNGVNIENYTDNQGTVKKHYYYPDVIKNPMIEGAITDQKGSLDQWVDYLSSKDATYPDWLKYYAFRSILGMGEYDKEKKQFTKRSKGTVKPFPDLNREALAYVLDAIEKKCKKENVKFETEDEAEKQNFEKLLENFAKLYAFAIDKLTPASEEALANVAGQWVKYRQGIDDVRPLVESLQGHGTGWCTAGESTAKAQLQNGDFYVYYSLDENKKPNIPRAAIRMQGEQIAEVRGIAPDQNLDSYIGDKVKEKLSNRDEFPDGAVYEKKSADMKLLTVIENKTKQNKQLTKDELVFLYEIDRKIEGFGYQRDPRIKEIMETRNPDEDAPIVLECQSDEIAHSKEDITNSTKAYVGELMPGIFDVLPKNIEHVYTKFPEGRIQFKNIMLNSGPKNADDFQKAITAEGHEVYGWAKDILKKIKFESSTEKTEAELVILNVASLGFKNGAKRQDIYNRAIALGLELSPAEVGPELRLQYKKEDQPKGEYLLVGMEPIADSGGRLGVFCVFRREVGRSWLDADRGSPSSEWGADDRWVFVRRKSLES